jgi:hypothetical protein
MGKVYVITDTHKAKGTEGHRIARASAHCPREALNMWWDTSPRNDGGPLDTDRYTADPET